MCVSMTCVFKFVSKTLGSFPDLLVKMLTFIGVVTGMFFMGNTVSDPSSVINGLKNFNTTSTSPTCDGKQVAHHYKNLAFDITFLSIAMALAACVVCCVKIIVDAGAREEEEEEADPIPARRANLEHESACQAYGAAWNTEDDARRAFMEMQAAFYHAGKVANDARSKANRAVQAANADLDEAKTNPADDVVAAQNEVAKAEENLEVITKQLKEAEADVTRKETATCEAKKSKEDAKKAADAFKPKTGMARFPCSIRWILRALVLFATVVSIYSCIVATHSFVELLEYKTGCVRFEGDSESRHVARIALSIFRGLLYLAFSLLHLMFALGALCTN